MHSPNGLFYSFPFLFWYSMPFFLFFLIVHCYIVFAISRLKMLQVFQVLLFFVNKV